MIEKTSNQLYNNKQCEEYVSWFLHGYASLCFDRLCIVLISKKAEESERKKFRRYLRKSMFLNNERVRFTYIYEETQSNVIQTLNKNEDTENKKTMKVEYNTISLTYFSLQIVSPYRKHLF